MLDRLGHLLKSKRQTPKRVVIRELELSLWFFLFVSRTGPRRFSCSSPPSEIMTRAFGGLAWVLPILTHCRRRSGLRNLPKFSPQVSFGFAADSPVNYLRTSENVRFTYRSTKAMWRLPGGDRYMSEFVFAQIAALKTSPIGTLKQKLRDLFESKPPPYNRRFS